MYIYIYIYMQTHFNYIYIHYPCLCVCIYVDLTCICSRVQYCRSLVDYNQSPFYRFLNKCNDQSLTQIGVTRSVETSASQYTTIIGSRTKWYWTKWYGQNGMDKMVWIRL